MSGAMAAQVREQTGSAASSAARVVSGLRGGLDGASGLDVGFDGDFGLDVWLDGNLRGRQWTFATFTAAAGRRPIEPRFALDAVLRCRGDNHVLLELRPVSADQALIGSHQHGIW